MNKHDKTTYGDYTKEALSQVNRLLNSHSNCFKSRNVSNDDFRNIMGGEFPKTLDWIEVFSWFSDYWLVENQNFQRVKLFIIYDSK